MDHSDATQLIVTKVKGFLKAALTWTITLLAFGLWATSFLGPIILVETYVSKGVTMSFYLFWLGVHGAIWWYVRLRLKPEDETKEQGRRILFINGRWGGRYGFLVRKFHKEVKDYPLWVVKEDKPTYSIYIGHGCEIEADESEFVFCDGHDELLKEDAL